MKNILLLALVCGFLVPINSFSQKGSNHLKINGGAEVTTGTFKEGYKTGWGIYATDYLGLDSKSSILFSTGVAQWDGDNSSFEIGLIFLKTGYRLFAIQNLYLQGEVGLAKGFKEYNDGTYFTYSAGLGYLFKIGNSGVDISTKYNRFDYRSWFSIHVGYQFRL